MEEPYKVIEVTKGDRAKYRVVGGAIELVKDERYYFTISYRNYSKAGNFTITAKDELEAFMKGQKRLDKTKKHYDKYGKKRRKEQTS
jgi:hypothetical protein